MIGSISVLLVLGGAGGSNYFVRTTHRGTAATQHPIGGTRPSHPAVFEVVAISPTSGQKAVGYSPLIRVQFSQPLARHWSLPSLTPTIPGSWVHTGRSTLEFRPKGNFVPFSKVTLSLRGGRAGLRDGAGVALADPYQASFVIAAGSVLRLQQLLAELGYMPLDFEGVTTTGTSSSSDTFARAGPHHLIAAIGASPSPAVEAATGRSSFKTASDTSVPLHLARLATATLDREASRPAAIDLRPRAGSFSWRFSDIPSSLATSWQPGVDTVLVRAAVMSFESAHGLPADGDAGPQVWTALLHAIAQRQVSSAPYDYIEVTTSSPETLSVWRVGKIIYQSLANTGIAEEPTALGTYPVYLRYNSTTMSGYNPDGSHYDDPGVPYVAYFNGGDAVHGFLRAQYGYPQSLGCVELSYANAAVVFNYDPIGTLVNVS
ncbi:MAG TPA: L,D-transpeptidase family protein [Acidimicrobiales bacterium]